MCQDFSGWLQGLTSRSQCQPTLHPDREPCGGPSDDKAPPVVKGPIPLSYCWSPLSSWSDQDLGSPASDSPGETDHPYVVINLPTV